ncbi:efflux RND transporter periplasmic adaptor subunit [Picosynechococcus sp. PCC 73109]|uniref:efflux RND transporter periplasmic adaptor subunit n=1 Tax=Picosynechococcus sp. PCC 73109 TaxID=374982 RepID=UPI000745922B|nr:efflux RND transporter periplasmic adaptor subunit [Picosynechococcus sp. PCC 73109]AMA09192.1 efflux transporter periplasmic adaptor subunit [Picosynechococcus sp. PCC 73109]
MATNAVVSSKVLDLQLKPWLYGLGIIAVAGICVVLFRPKPIPVEVVTIKPGPLQVMVIEEGQTYLEDRYLVSTSVAGYVPRLDLEVGDPVSQDQVIAQIDPLEFDNDVSAILAQINALQAEKTGVATLRPKTESLTQAEAKIKAVEAEIAGDQAIATELRIRFIQAQQEQQRGEFLYRNGAISKQALETLALNTKAIAQNSEVAQQRLNQAQANLQEAIAARDELRATQQDPDYLLEVYDAQIRSLEAELANRTDQVQRTAIKAPISGQVLRLYQKNYQYLEAGQPLLELGDLQNLAVMVDVLSSEATQIQPGNPVIIDQWGGDRPLTGQVKRLEPAAFTKVSALGVEEQRVNVVVSLDDIPANLGDQYRVETQIVVWQARNVLQVPLSALFRCDEQWCVFLVEAGQAQAVAVEIGHKTEQNAQVKSGLAANDQVILYPSGDIQTGRRVQPQADRAAPTN